MTVLVTRTKVSTVGQFEDMKNFIRVVEAGGISKAAEQLGLAKSAVSRRLHDLEKRLGTQLLSRTTRQSSLTEKGQLYYQEALNILDQVHSLNEQTSGIKACVEGTLKITAPLSFSLMHLSEAIDQYAREHPALDFELDFSDRFADLVEDGYELAIRIGELQDSTYQARRITPIRFVLCASPKYLEEAGIPHCTDDLKDHKLLQYGLLGPGRITLTDADNNQRRISFHSAMKVNNGDFLNDMTVMGHGICCLPTFICYKDIINGKLIPLLTNHKLPVYYAWAVHPRNRFLSRRCKLLIEHLGQYFGDDPYWDKSLSSSSSSVS